MELKDTGYIYNIEGLPEHRRNCAFTTVYRCKDGTLLVSGRWGSQRDSPDGHASIYASSDEGRTWSLRFDGYGQGALENTAGEFKGLTSTELRPGRLTATALWVDRSEQKLPFIHPNTQGLLPMRIIHTCSEDGGATWSTPKPMDTAPHVASSPCSSSIIKLADGVLAQPYESWKEYTDVTPGKPAARLRFSYDQGKTWPDYATVAQHPDDRLAYWDHRLAIHPENGRLVAMFWTHDLREGVDLNIHIAYGSPNGRVWTTPVDTGLHGQHCQPLSLGGGRLLALYPRRQDPPGIIASYSEDFGNSWNHEDDLMIYDSKAGTESGVTGSRTQEELWGDMERWRFGHPRAVRLTDEEMLVVYYAGDDLVKSARWARVKLQSFQTQ